MVINGKGEVKEKRFFSKRRILLITTRYYGYEVCRILYFMYILCINHTFLEISGLPGKQSFILFSMIKIIKTKTNKNFFDPILIFLLDSLKRSLKMDVLKFIFLLHFGERTASFFFYFFQISCQSLFFDCRL